MRFARCAPDRLPMAVPSQGTRVVIYAVLTAQMLPEECGGHFGYDLYGSHHANGAWASQHRRTHDVSRVVHTTQIALRVDKGAKVVENSTCDLYGAHRADGTSNTLGTSFSSQLGVRSVRCSPRISHVYIFVGTRTWPKAENAFCGVHRVNRTKSALLPPLGPNKTSPKTETSK